MTLGSDPLEGVQALRNVVLLGSSGSGKTSLAEHLLHASGASHQLGSVDSGTSVLDRDPAALLQRRSVALTVASFGYAGCRITLIDTPGFAEYLGEVRAGMRAADAALFVVSSIDGIDSATRSLWDECEAINMPRAVVVTHIDQERADFDETIAVCHRMFTGGRGVLPLHLPVLDDDSSFAGVLDLLSNRIHEWTSSEHRQREADPEHLSMTADARIDLIEGIIAESEDESLMERFIEGEDLGASLLTADLEKAVARGHFHPVLAFSGASGVGAELILDLITSGLPSPLERPLPTVTTPDGLPMPPLAADPNGPLCAEVIKTTTDPHLGKISLLRVFSGRLPAESTLHISGHFQSREDRHDHDVTERDGQISLLFGDRKVPQDTAIAGCLVAVTRLVRAETGDTISATSMPMLVEPWLMPVPQLPIAITVKDLADEARLHAALERLVAEDPTLRTDHSNGQLVLWCLGEAHASLAIDRLRERFGIDVAFQELKISLRESFVSAADGEGRHVAGSGSHSRSAVCRVRVEPLSQGEGIEIEDQSVAGSIPRTYLGAVERGIRQQLAHGCLSGYPMTDVRVIILGGKADPRDSSDHDFQLAGSLAVADAAARAELCLLEPMAELTVITPEEFVGAVSGDISMRRGQVTATESGFDGTTKVTALVPLHELSRYAIDIRSIAHGTAQFSLESAGFARVPRTLTKRLLPIAD